MLCKKRESYPRRFPIMQQPSTIPNKYQQEQIDRKFGMFLHFGINTFNNTELSDGKLPVESYCPSEIDAENWVKTAYEAGMNFIVLVTKHHDGFCLWDTHTTEYSVNYSPLKTDVVRVAYEACKKYNIKLGLYYSLWDRNVKCYKNNEAYVQYMEKQLTELLDGRYGEIVELWLDGSWDKSCRDWQLDRLYSLVKSLQPCCQFGVNGTMGKYSDKKRDTNNRFAPENQELYDPIRMFPSDFRLWDPHMCREDDPKLFTFKGETYYLPFEQTICSRRQPGTWFYCDNYEMQPLQNVDEMIRDYRILEKTQNIMVLNLPPDKSGKLVQSDVDNLMQFAHRLGIARSKI